MPGWGLSTTMPSSSSALFLTVATSRLAGCRISESVNSWTHCCYRMFKIEFVHCQPESLCRQECRACRSRTWSHPEASRQRCPSARSLQAPSSSWKSKIVKIVKKNLEVTWWGWFAPRGTRRCVQRVSSPTKRELASPTRAHRPPKPSQEPPPPATTMTSVVKVSC